MKRWCLLAIASAMLVLSCKEKAAEDKPVANPVHVQLVADLNKQVRQYPDSPQVRLRLVDALDSLGNYRDALVQLDTMLMRDSINNGLWFRKGLLYESLQDTMSAIRSYETALNIYPSIDAQLSLANLLAEKKDKRCLAITENLKRMGVDRETTAHCYFIAGVYYARINDAAKALASFDQCINNNYTYMEAYMEKGFVLYDAKKYKEAEQVFDRAITVNNLYADAYYWKAKTLEAIGNKQDAVINYQRSLGLDKTLKEAREALKRLE